MNGRPAGTTLEVRFHGRGGQGVVTAAEVLSVAAFAQGLHAQAFPTFGSERTGAPVVAYCRISDRQIRAHEPVLAPDALVVQDPTLLHHVPVFAGASPATVVLVNTSRTLESLGLDDLAGGGGPLQVLAVPATDLARRLLGRPLPNTALLGAFAAQTQVVSLASVSAAIRQRFDDAVAEANVRVAEAAYDLVARQTTPRQATART